LWIGRHEREKKDDRVWWQSIEERNHLEDLGVDGNMKTKF
jgi:hypothetical protein